MALKNRRANKPGPKPSGGLKRTIPFLVMLNADEYEYLTRIHRRYEKKIVQILRDRVFPARWLTHLQTLREKQGANVK